MLGVQYSDCISKGPLAWMQIIYNKWIIMVILGGRVAVGRQHSNLCTEVLEQLNADIGVGAGFGTQDCWNVSV